MDVPTTEMSRLHHTQQVIRNRKLKYQPLPWEPDAYPLAFNAWLSDWAGHLRLASFAIDRIINQEGVLWHISKRMHNSTEISPSCTTLWTISSTSLLRYVNEKEGIDMQRMLTHGLFV